MSPINISKKLKLYETSVFKHMGLSSLHTDGFAILSGSRIIFTLQLINADPGASARLIIRNAFAVDIPPMQVLEVNQSGVGSTTRVLTDFHNVFEYTIEALGGTVDAYIGISIVDNAMTTRIDNAIVQVDLSASSDVNGEHDSIRIGDGENELDINEDGSLPTSDILRTQGYNSILQLQENVVVLGRAQAVAKVNRKMVFFEAKTKGVKWGYELDSQPFDIFKRQILALPLGVTTPIYFTSTLPTAEVIFGEV